MPTEMTLFKKGMNREMTTIANPLTQLMGTGKTNLLNIYFTAGYPDLDDTSTILKALQDGGADMVEIGIPFSDPLADGPTIQGSNMTALGNGMSVNVLFDQLERIEFTVPVILMGYFNPILQYGVEDFCARCSAIGVSGVIIPDLPLEYYVAKYQEIFEKNNLSNIFLVSPQTSMSRIQEIDRYCSGFIYAVSSSSTTGSKSTVNNIDDYLQSLNSMNLRNPIMTGFNIHDSVSFRLASKYTRGAIIGSAFIRELAIASDIEKAVLAYIKKIRA